MTWTLCHKIRFNIDEVCERSKPQNCYPTEIIVNRGVQYIDDSLCRNNSKPDKWPLKMATMSGFFSGHWLVRRWPGHLSFICPLEVQPENSCIDLYSSGLPKANASGDVTWVIVNLICRSRHHPKHGGQFPYSPDQHKQTEQESLSWLITMRQTWRDRPRTGSNRSMYSHCLCQFCFHLKDWRQPKDKCRD